MPARSNLGVYALLALMPLFFVSNLVIGRAAIADVEPWTLAFWRWGLAAALLLPFAWREIAAEAARLRAAVAEILALGFLGMILCGGLVYVGLSTTTATHGALIYASSSIMIVLIEAAAFGRALSLRTLAGAVIGFTGVAVILLEGDLTRLLQLEFNHGDLVIAVSAFSWAVYSVVLKRERVAKLPILPLFAMIAVVGALLLVPPMLYEAVTLDAFPRGMRAWAEIAALAIFPSVLAFGLYQYGVKRVGPSVTGIYLYLLPPYGVALAWILLGEQPKPYHLVGLILVVGGVILATGGFGAAGIRPSRPRSEKSSNISVD
jgi:drug/metabolite transporter (DMT)-like permease